MSNDKAAATYGTGQIVHWPVGMTRTACGKDQEGGLPVTLTNRKVQVTCEGCRMALEVVFGPRFGAGPGDNETTGEHVWNKLQDDLYADFEPTRDVPETVSHSEHTEFKRAGTATGRFSGVGPHFEELDRPLSVPKRGWTPTPGELGLACGIVGLIVLLFVFVVIFYRW